MIGCAAVLIAIGCGSNPRASAAPVHAMEARRLIQQCEVRSAAFTRGGIFLGLRSGDMVRYEDDETEGGRRALTEALGSVPEACEPIDTTVDR